jgi:DNA recombination protein RmuC
MIEALLGLVIGLLAVLIFLVWKTRGVGTKDVEAAVSRTWVELGLGERVQAVASEAREIRASYRSLEQMLRVPTERAALGEIGLETMLADQLPADMFMVRQRVMDGKIPDAAIRSTIGLICVDCKFPLDNYARLVANEGNEAAGLERQFLRDVRGHLAKIADDYVRPEKGSAPFALAYIPSEAVYYFLATHAFDMLREFTGKGVQVVSPLTFSHKLALIQAGVHARRLSENAVRVSNDLHALSRRFAAVDGAWRVFYERHLKNLTAKAEEVDRAYKGVRQAFDSLAEIAEETPAPERPSDPVPSKDDR